MSNRLFRVMDETTSAEPGMVTMVAVAVYDRGPSVERAERFEAPARRSPRRPPRPAARLRPGRDRAPHTIVITALRSDHSTYTVDGNVSNHSAGRAMDIGAVDGETCRGTRSGPCAQLVRELAAIDGIERATELIYCWDPDGPSDPRGFARADHCDHIHWGIDG